MDASYFPLINSIGLRHGNRPIISHRSMLCVGLRDDELLSWRRDSDTRHHNGHLMASSFWSQEYSWGNCTSSWFDAETSTPFNQKQIYCKLSRAPWFRRSIYNDCPCDDNQISPEIFQSVWFMIIDTSVNTFLQSANCNQKIKLWLIN